MSLEAWPKETQPSALVSTNCSVLANKLAEVRLRPEAQLELVHSLVRAQEEKSVLKGGSERSLECVRECVLHTTAVQDSTLLG